MTHNPEHSKDDLEAAEINLLATTDARVWASEFVRIYDSQKERRAEIDVEWMTTWFANAIQTGITHARSRPEPGEMSASEYRLLIDAQKQVLETRNAELAELKERMSLSEDEQLFLKMLASKFDYDAEYESKKWFPDSNEYRTCLAWSERLRAIVDSITSSRGTE